MTVRIFHPAPVAGADRIEGPSDFMPAGVRIEKVYDQASLVREAVGSVRDAMLIGALLAVLVLFLFLRHGRITAISATAIPLTLAITILAMKLLGSSFNLMSLGGMAVAIGLVIDDAVVVTENIARHLALNPDRHVAIPEAIGELVWPVTTSTLTTVVVFLPLGLLQGVVGQFFVALSTTLVVAVLVSLATMAALAAPSLFTTTKAPMVPSIPAIRCRRCAGISSCCAANAASCAASSMATTSTWTRGAKRVPTSPPACPCPSGFTAARAANAATWPCWC